MKSFTKVDPPLTEEELAAACRLVMAYEIATTYPDETHVFRSSYEIAIQELLHKTADGTIEPARVRMGWQYYARKGLAAVLIGVLLAGITMPEKVMAGCKWLITVVEEFLEDRTRYKYTSNISEDVGLIEMTFGYLPEGMGQKVEEYNNAYVKLYFSIDSVVESYYFSISQKPLVETRERVHGNNVEIYDTEILVIQDEVIEISIRNDIIYFAWIHDLLHISGQTNLSKAELIQILENIKFEA